MQDKHQLVVVLGLSNEQSRCPVVVPFIQLLSPNSTWYMYSHTLNAPQPQRHTERRYAFPSAAPKALIDKDY